MVFCTAVLTLEAFVVLFAALVGHGLRLAQPGLVWSVAGVGVLLCLLAAGLVRRRAGLVLGSAVQVALLVAGMAIPMMYVVGGIFAAIWVVALLLGRRIDTERAQRAAIGEEAAPGAA